ncbi:hypothetical protein GCM10023065_31590 [Microbacterium laevaniformans]
MRVAGPLDAAQQERLAGALSTRYGADVTVNVVVDPEVLGGMRVEIGDDVIDGTVSSRINDLRQRLAGLEQKEHHGRSDHPPKSSVTR